MDERKSTYKTLFVLIGIVVLFGVVTYFVQKNAANNNLPTDGATALSASEATPYTDLEGNPFSFSQYEGQVRVVNSWATWCPFCVEELRDFEELAKEYEAQGVVVIAINRMESKERARSYLNTLGVFEETVFVVDLTDAFYKAIGGFTMPETIFYDRDGNIVVHKRGFMALPEMREHVEAALRANESEV